MTRSEAYLARLGERSFLRLWSYPNPFRDQGGGKEICDLMVVFGDDILIFSDKSCAFPDSGNLQTDWSRWYRRAVLESSDQLFGAERWLRQFPDRVFLDRECTIPFPLVLPATEQMRIHRIVVALGAKERCREHFGGGSGSLMHFSDITSDVHKDWPFALGKIDPTRGFVHVFDDVMLDFVMNELDTLSDFVEYLHCKQSFLGATQFFSAPGEEELLALYLRNRATDEPERFGLPTGYSGIGLEEGFWEELQKDIRFKARKHFDKVSYFWDRLIDDFGSHALGGTLLPAGGSVCATERVLRNMAREPRFQRRMLSSEFLKFVDSAKPRMISRRTVVSDAHNGTIYVFMCVPHLFGDDAEYRTVRRNHLSDFCFVVASRYREYERVIGIATEPGTDLPTRSHDISMIEKPNWTPELDAEAMRLREEHGFFDPDKVTVSNYHAVEYPKAPTSDHNRATPPLSRTSKHIAKPGRNDPCPCGSGEKYKRCCGMPRRKPRA